MSTYDRLVYSILFIISRLVTKIDRPLLARNTILNDMVICQLCTHSSQRDGIASDIIENESSKVRHINIVKRSLYYFYECSGISGENSLEIISGVRTTKDERTLMKISYPISFFAADTKDNGAYLLDELGWLR